MPKKKVEVIFALINKLSESLTPEHHIKHWGPLQEFLRSFCYIEEFNDYIEDIEDEEERNELRIVILRKLLEEGTFDENDDEHLVHAIDVINDYLEMRS